MIDKPTPEEQLLRLIESEEAKTFTAEPKEKPVSSAEVTGPSVSERFQNISRWFSYKRVNIKLVNRVLTVITVGLSLYLIWSMVQKPLSSDEIIGNIRKGVAFDVKPTEVPTIPYDNMDIKRVLDTRKSIFVQVEKAPPPPPPPPVIVNPPTTPTNSSNVQVIPPNQIIEEIKKKYKYRLVGIMQAKGRHCVTIEKEGGVDSEILVAGENRRIRGDVDSPGGEGKISFTFMIKAVDGNSVVLIDEVSKLELPLVLEVTE